MKRVLTLALGLAMALAAVGCGSLPGRPGPVPSELKTGRVTNFDALFQRNCQGCHGASGKGSAAIALADPVYLALASDDVIRQAVADGISGTSMPAFAESAGGTLDAEQVDTLVKGIRAWQQPARLAGVKLPPYAPDLQGNPQRGARVYNTFCASCHGPSGRGGKTAGSIVDPSALALISNQGLRTIVIMGRPSLGAPDWRGNVPGRPMTDQEITDVVIWLEAHRVAYPGQPYPTRAGAARKEGDK